MYSITPFMSSSKTRKTKLFSNTYIPGKIVDKNKEIIIKKSG